MITEKSKQRKLGVMLGYINFAVKLFTQLVYVPIMLKLLGQSEYGVYQLVASIISYLGLLNFGFGGSYYRFYSQCKGDIEKEKKLNGTYLFVFSFFAILAFILGVIICVNAQSILGNKLTVEEVELSRVLLFILVINMSLTFPISVFSSIVSSREAFVFQKLVELIRNLANPILTIIILLIGKGSIGMVCVTTILTIFAGLVNVWYVKNKIKTEFSFRSIDFRLIKEIGIFSFFIFLNVIIDQVNWNVDKYLLGRIIGSAAIAIYSIGAQINTIYVQISDMTASVMAPRVNSIVAEQTQPFETLNRMFVKVGRIQAYIILAIVMGFISLGKDFIMLWAGAEYQEAYYVTILLIAPGAISLMQSLGVDIQRALNKHQIRSLVYFGLSLANILISIILIRKMGASGAALGTAISIIIGNGIVMNIVYHKYIGLDVLSFWKKVFPIISTSFISFLVSIMINHFLNSVTWVYFIIKGMIFLLVYILTEYFIAFNKEEKSMLKNFIYPLWRRLLAGKS